MAARELEFAVHSLCTTHDGYKGRSRTSINAAKLIAKSEAWDTAEDEEFEEARDVVNVIRRLSQCTKSQGKARAD